MKNKIRVLILLIFCLYSAFFVVGSILSPIMAHFQHYESSARLTMLYIYSCHQQPTRTFWILGYPMALCCRCLGIYLGVVIFSLIAIFNKLNVNIKSFLIFLALVIADISINMGLLVKSYNTGNIIRFLVGVVIGLLLVVILQFLYERIWKRLCLKN